MKPPNIIRRFASCATNGQCKAEHCELWDTYSQTCSIRAILFELREQTRELKDRRQYLKRKTVEELGDMDGEELFSCEKTLRQRNDSVLEMSNRIGERKIQKPGKIPEHDEEKHS